MNPISRLIACLAALGLLAFHPRLAAQTTATLTSLHSFTGVSPDGKNPQAALVSDGNGNFYGTTNAGGSHGFGTVFELPGGGAPVTVYSFDGTFGKNPRAGLVQGHDGNFYGTAKNGGANSTGAIFSITPAGVPTFLYSFGALDGNGFNGDGAQPLGALIADGAGNLFGTASAGGASGGGTIFEITATGGFVTLYSFTGGADGKSPQAALVMDGAGNFYGTTEAGGSGQGTVFQLPVGGVPITLHTFSGGDGKNPLSALVFGRDGNLYGTTQSGGGNGFATIFQLTTTSTFTDLYNFTGGADGKYPNAGLVLGNDGNFYGTAYNGGGGFGTVFQITPAGGFTVLHSFVGTDGSNPVASLIQASDGSFYGTTQYGGSASNGTVFKLDLVPPGTVQFASAAYDPIESAGHAALTVSRTGGNGGAVTVGYTTADGTALAGTDYTATSGTLSWADGDTADKTVTVPLIDRGLYNGATVTFSVTLANATGGAALGATPTASVNILDNDTAPQPTVVVASPPDGVTLVAGTDLPLAATVSDPGGILASVQFTLDGANVGTTLAATPFVSDATVPVTLGAHVFQAIATDTQGRTSTGTANINVIAPTVNAAPPTTFLVSAIAGRDVPAGVPLGVCAAAGADAATSLVQLSFYADGVLLQTIPIGPAAPSTTAAPGRPVRRDAAVVPSVQFAAGTTYTPPAQDKIVNLVSVALDKLGRSTVSKVASFHVKIANHPAPVVAISGVMDNQHSAVGVPITINVDAHAGTTTGLALPQAGPGRADAASDARLAELEYFFNGTSVGKATQPPFSVTFTPPSSGVYVFNTVGTDASGLATVSAPIGLNVDDAPVITSAPTASVPVNVAFNYQITASGAPTGFAADGLPVGLTVDAATGVISGTPTTAGVYNVTLSASNAGATGTAALTLTVVAAKVIVIPTVSVATSDGDMAVEGGAKGVVLVTRTGGDNSAALIVTYKVKGAAVAGVDYKMLPGTVTISAGAGKAKIKIKPIDGSPNAGVLKIKIVLVAPMDGSYTVGTGTAKLKLIGK